MLYVSWFCLTVINSLNVRDLGFFSRRTNELIPWCWVYKELSSLQDHHQEGMRNLTMDNGLRTDWFIFVGKKHKAWRNAGSCPEHGDSGAAECDMCAFMSVADLSRSRISSRESIRHSCHLRKCHPFYYLPARQKKYAYYNTHKTPFIGLGVIEHRSAGGNGLAFKKGNHFDSYDLVIIFVVFVAISAFLEIEKESFVDPTWNWSVRNELKKTRYKWNIAT